MPRQRLTREMVGGQPYTYFALGRHVVSAPAVCGGRPTFKHTRIEVAGVLERLGAGHSLAELVSRYEGRVTAAAIREATRLAARALTDRVAEPLVTA